MIKWKTRSGEIVDMRNLNPSHLHNIAALLKRHQAARYAEIEKRYTKALCRAWLNANNATIQLCYIYSGTIAVDVSIRQLLESSVLLLEEMDEKQFRKGGWKTKQEVYDEIMADCDDILEKHHGGASYEEDNLEELTQEYYEDQWRYGKNS